MKKSNYISIKQYLENRGISPVKDRGYYGLYHSPLREDNNPSFKVDYNKDLWHDFGTDEGGSIVDLVMKLENCTLAEAFRRLENSFFFHRDNTPTTFPIATNKEAAMAIKEIKPLAHPSLLDYLKERNINKDIAKHYCSEVHYSIANKPYFAIGFKSDAGSYELRNKYFKGCTTPKNITTINKHSDTVMIFEGFMDLLSYLSLKQNASPTIDTVVLNSIANLSKAIPFLQSHKTVHAFFDNDEAGRKSLVSLREQLTSSELIDQSVFYQNHKDLNDYWQNKSKPQKQFREDCITTSGKRQIPMKKKGRGI
jgi:DNA primase